MVPQRHQDKSECSVFFVLGGGGGQRVFVDKDKKRSPVRTSFRTGTPIPCCTVYSYKNKLQIFFIRNHEQ